MQTSCGHWSWALFLVFTVNHGRVKPQPFTRINDWISCDACSFVFNVYGGGVVEFLS